MTLCCSSFRSFLVFAQNNNTQLQLASIATVLSSGWIQSIRRYYPQALGAFNDLQTQICLHFIITYPVSHAAQAVSYGQF
jgi:hypothetical protein